MNITILRGKIEICLREVENNILDLSKRVQIYLESDWNRVKYESIGKIYDDTVEKFDYYELCRKFEQPLYKNNIWKRFYISLKAKVSRSLALPRNIIITLIFFCFICTLIKYLI